jgi:hypothetical protein
MGQMKTAGRLSGSPPFLQQSYYGDDDKSDWNGTPWR